MTLTIYILCALVAIPGMVKSKSNSFSYFLFGWCLALAFSQLLK